MTECKSVCMNLERTTRVPKKLCGLLDLPPPVSPQSWNTNKKRIQSVLKIEASKSMSTAANEAKASQGAEITVSCDGTWQRRGFSSKNGVVTVATVNGANSKLVDVETLTNYCHSCSRNKNNTHTCEKNHTGSAGAMESAGVKIIFCHSEEKHCLKYSGYLGDGDSKSYKSLVSCDPPIYPDVDIKKLECVGHIQKRMGRKLSNLVTACKNRSYTFDNGKKTKGIGGQKKLTKIAIHRIQGHFGGAIRKHVGDEAGMRNAVWAIFHHRAGKHDICGDWCPSKSGNLEKANQSKLPAFVMEEMKPVFESLSSHELLAKCTHGGTQNVNESFHHVIWSLCPKEIFVGRMCLKIAVSSAVIQFNDGMQAKISYLNQLGITGGHYTKLYLLQKDRKRVRNSLTNKSKKAKRRTAQEKTYISQQSADYALGICADDD